MKVIIGNPGSGKTKEILVVSAKTNVPVLCESEARKQRLLVKATGYGLTIPCPITVDQITSETPAVLIDDIERFFQVAFNVKVEAVTINRETNVEVVDID